MNGLDKPFGLHEDSGGLGLQCAESGLALAGVPLLRLTVAGFTPRPAAEVGALMKAAYSRDFDARALSAGLNVVADALNKGEVGRAMIAAVRLRLAELDPEDAQTLRNTDASLSKYNQAELRDDRGRWTTGGADSDTSDNPDALKPIPVATPPVPANSNLRTQACDNAGRQCVVNALNDTVRDKDSKSRYFSACQTAEDTCLMVLAGSRAFPQQAFRIVFPDHTVVGVQAGISSILYIHGKRLAQPWS